eukprot:TRINITY_DN2405_c0_g1_i1.p1 TRINITY_DN2405_c0_g1~~TRINITY_DN2405_c0_g1_i1.p1  ORF type:complete len:189 (-),score=51.32 TRINITY_DN2405_c0_g1_i1:48-587(-)
MNGLPGYDLKELVYAPLSAVAEAQYALNENTLSFLRTVQADCPTTTMKWTIPSSDQQQYSISVPTLSLVDIPLLEVKDVDISFSASLSASETVKIQEYGKDETSGTTKTGVKYKGAVAASSSVKRKTDTSATFSVTVKTSVKSHPDGLSRVLNLIYKTIPETYTEEMLIDMNETSSSDS